MQNNMMYTIYFDDLFDSQNIAICIIKHNTTIYSQYWCENKHGQQFFLIPLKIWLVLDQLKMKILETKLYLLTLR